MKWFANQRILCTKDLINQNRICFTKNKIYEILNIDIMGGLVVTIKAADDGACYYMSQEYHHAYAFNINDYFVTLSEARKNKIDNVLEKNI
jgi:hypothetical protein